jgi:glucans biosynthesis protein C
VVVESRLNSLGNSNHATSGKPYSSQKTVGFIPDNIDSVRGLTCLLIVALHMVGSDDTDGLHLPMNSAWHYAMQSIEFLRIPLFTALSGYLYAGNRVTRQKFSQFWVKKLRRLSIPLVFATVVIWSLRTHISAEQTPLIHALLFQYLHLWYLQALLILFATISITDAFFRLSPVGLVLVGLTAIMVSQAGITVTTCLGLAGSFYLAPYFLFGILLREHPEWLRDQRFGRLTLGIIVIVLTSQQLGLFGITNGVTSLQLPAAVAGMAGVVFLLQRFPKNAMLAGIGHYSYTVFLWHPVAGSAMRSVLLRIGITGIPSLFVITLVAATAAPIVLYHIARRIPLLSVAVTGERWMKGAATLGRRESGAAVAAVS